MNNLPANLTDLITKEYENIAGIGILQNNRVTYEHYFGNYTKNDATHIASVTKSIVSILVGIAIDKGYIKSVHQKILDFFPDIKGVKEEKFDNETTIEDLLCMTAPFFFKNEETTKIYSKGYTTKTALAALKKENLRINFKYTTLGLQILSTILTQATNETLVEFANKHLFEPLGIEKPRNISITNQKEHRAFTENHHQNSWIIDSCGVNTSGMGLALKTTDLLKIGQMCLNQGIYGRKQIVSAPWLEKSTKAHSKWKNLDYGYLWWLTKEKHSYAALGVGGNVIYINNDLQVVVAINSYYIPKVKDRIKLIENHILKEI